MSRALAPVLALVLATACGARQTVAPTAGELVVFGAASLRDVLERIAAAYEAATPGVTVTLATDSSAALRTQIEQGAPADVFLAADVDEPRRLVRAGLADEVVPFASNALAIIAALPDEQRLRTPADLANHGVRVIAAGEEVPITRYAARLLEQLAALDGYPAWFLDGYAQNVVSREDNVQAVAAKIELGEGDAAIVYATDALGSDRIRVIPIPPGANVRAVYGGVALRDGRQPAGEAFLDWLRRPDGQRILADAGFLPPP